MNKCTVSSSEEINDALAQYLKAYSAISPSAISPTVAVGAITAATAIGQLALSAISTSASLGQLFGSSSSSSQSSEFRYSMFSFQNRTGLLDGQEALILSINSYKTDDCWVDQVFTRLFPGDSDAISVKSRKDKNCRLTLIVTLSSAAGTFGPYDIGFKYKDDKGWAPAANGKDYDRGVARDFTIDSSTRSYMTLFGAETQAGVSIVTLWSGSSGSSGSSPTHRG